MLSDSAMIVASDDVLAGEFDTEAVMLDLRSGVYYGLEGAGARIWQLLKSPISLAALRDALVAEYDVAPRRCEVDLRQLIDQGLFREDLFYRLKVFPINLPPLRQRREDIPLLCGHFIEAQNAKTGKRIAGLTQSSLRILMEYQWPGNVRELENAIEHAFVLCAGGYIDVFDLPVEIRQLAYPGRMDTREAVPETTRRQLTAEILTELLHDCDWNKARVGRSLGLSRTAVWKYMKKFDIPLKRPS